MRTLKISLLIIILSIPIASQQYWESTVGPEGGWVQCLAFSDNNIIYAGFDANWFGTNHKGRCFYKSVNGGLNWESINSIYSNKDIESIAIDTLGSIYLWEGGVGIIKSTDGGQNWINLSYNIDGFYRASLAVCRNNYAIIGHYDGVYLTTNGINWILTSLTGWVHSVFVDDGDNIFAGMYYGGVFKSTDYGSTWQESDYGLDGSRVNSIVQYDDSAFYAGSETGIFKSEDNGNSWNLINTSPSFVTSILVGIQDELMIGTKKDGFFISLDQGNTWVQRNNGLVNFYITSMIIGSDNCIVAGTYGDGVFISSNFGQNWQSFNTGIKSTHITAFLKYNDGLFAGSEQGMIYRSSNRGDTWTRIDTNYTFMPITSFLQSKQNSLFYSSYYFPFKREYKRNDWEDIGYFSTNELSDLEKLEAGKIFKSVDEGLSWKEVEQLYVNSFTSYLDSNSGYEFLISATGFSGVFISTDDGETWYSANNGIEGYIEDVETNSLGYFYASSTDKIYRSRDLGRSWEIIYAGISSVYHTTMAISLNDYIYAGHDWGKVILSTDNGDTWLDMGANLNVNRINSIITDSLNNVFVGNWWGEIFQSTNSGLTWRNIQSGMIGGPILNLYCDSDGSIYVGPYGGGVYRGVSSTFAPTKVTLFSPASGTQNVSLTPMLNWFSSPTAQVYRAQISLNENFDSLSIIYDYTVIDTSIIVDTLQEKTKYYWRVACSNEFGWSIWSNTSWFKTLSITSVDQESIHQFSYFLHQNFPNPFNPSTVISYQLPVTSIVTLKVYDVLGNEIVTLVNEEKPAGEYEVEFSPASSIKNPASGIYFYQLKAGTFVQTKKMLMIK